MLLYIHVPFCRSKCGYCAFSSRPLDGKDDLAAYLSTLITEIDLWGERLGRAAVETVFFGGGTPSLLPAKAVAGILDKAAAAFNISPSAEISLEANPESALKPGFLADIKKAGINRLSLGVQSFDDAVLQLLDRAHTARQAAEALEAARRAGFGNISLDLMWGLPGKTGPQTQLQWMRQLTTAADLQPDHISAYGLTLEEGTPLAFAVDEGLALPEEKVQSSMFMAGAEFLESRGFRQYEISNFARLGFECRHNLGYWEGADYLGLGPSAVSTLQKRRFAAPSGVLAWKQAVADKTIGSAFEKLEREDLLKELLMLRLRTAKGISFEDWRNASGKTLTECFGPLMRLLQQNGLAASRSGNFRLTRAGMLVSNAVLAHFFKDFSE